MNILTLKDYQELYQSLVLSSIALEEKLIRLETNANERPFTIERYTEALENIERLIDKIEPYID